MGDVLPLKEVVQRAGRMDDENYALGEHLFEQKTLKKGYTEHLEMNGNRSLAYISKGLIRAYYIDPKTGKEINSFFFQEGQFLVSFLIFTEDTPCNYYLEVLEETIIDTINLKELNNLYRTSHQWEHFGRILAEVYYRGSNARTESFIFHTPEERYLNLIKEFPKIFQRTSLINIASYLGVESQSLSRIRNRIAKNKK